MDDAALPIGSNPPEGFLYSHPDMDILRAAGDLCGHPGALIELNDRKHVRGLEFELFTCGSYHGVGYHRALSAELVINDPTVPATGGAERTRREVISPAIHAPCPYKIVPLGNLAPESCNRHLSPSPGYAPQPWHPSRQHCGSFRSLRRSGVFPPPHEAAGRPRKSA
jgi:hypothetical protein